MRTSTVWLLLVVVLALGGGVLWQLRREKSGAFDADRALFEGLAIERLSEIRIDSIERGLQMRVVRGEDGTWQIVDPIDYPAEPAVMERLIEVVAKNRASAVVDGDPKSMQLDPPRVVLELTESLPAGPRKRRLEIGARDLDGRSVLVRQDGTILRTLRNLDTTLERDLPAWRRRAILSISPESVIEFHRSGELELPPPELTLDLALDAAS